MSHYPDLSPCQYFRNEERVLIAVGWLEKGYDYEVGDVSEEVLERLSELLVSAPKRLSSYVRFGSHSCSLCPNGDASIQEVFGRRIRLGTHELFIPASGRKVYASPSTIIHYIIAHGYKPPPEFQQAVLQCPPVRSLRYYSQLWSRGLGVII